MIMSGVQEAPTMFDGTQETRIKTNSRELISTINTTRMAQDSNRQARIPQQCSNSPRMRWLHK